MYTHTCSPSSARERRRLKPLELSGFCDYSLCLPVLIHVTGCTCGVFVCMCPLVMNVQPCCWWDPGAWICGSLAAVRTLDLALFSVQQCTHPLASKKICYDQRHIFFLLFSLPGLLCVQVFQSWYDQNVLSSYLLTFLCYLHCSFQIKLSNQTKRFKG